jgi:hypothetical protein
VTDILTVGDVSLSAGSYHGRMTTTTRGRNQDPSAAGNLQVNDMVVVGSRHAQTLFSHGRWYCVIRPPDRAVFAGFVDPVFDVVDPGSTVTSTTLAGRVVWHLHMTVALGGNRRNALATVDQDVEQQSARLIRQTISAHGVLAEHVTGTVRVVIQYTKYGERGRVVLPPACRRG